MSEHRPSQRPLEDLAADLTVERGKLDTLVESLAELLHDWEVEGASRVRLDAAALRLQSLCTGIERCMVQIVRVLNGGTPEGADWHRRLMNRMTIPTGLRPAVLSEETAAALGELLRFRHVVRHLYAYELEPEAVERLLRRALTGWPRVRLAGVGGSP